MNVTAFRPLGDVERRRLVSALRSNAEQNATILLDRRNTSFIGVADDVTDEDAIAAVKSVPSHY